MTFESLIRAIADDFTNAWNRWDIDAMMKHLCPNVLITSPNISLVDPSNSENKIVGKENVLAYWEKLKMIQGPIIVVQESFEKIDTVIQTKNRIIGKNILITESFKLNEYGKIQELHYSYTYLPADESS